jgi:hypothetical protein
VAGAYPGVEISEKRGAASHLGRTRMRGYDLPTVIKLLEIHRGVPHHRMLSVRYLWYALFSTILTVVTVAARPK